MRGRSVWVCVSVYTMFICKYVCVCFVVVFVFLEINN